MVSKYRSERTITHKYDEIAVLEVVVSMRDGKRRDFCFSVTGGVASPSCTSWVRCHVHGVALATLWGSVSRWRTLEDEYMTSLETAPACILRAEEASFQHGVETRTTGDHGSAYTWWHTRYFPRM